MSDLISRKAVLDKIKEVCFSKEQEWKDFRMSLGSNGQRDFIINFIESLPSIAPQSEIIRCKDCKWFGEIGCAISIVDDEDKPTEYDFCSFAERKEDDSK